MSLMLEKNADNKTSRRNHNQAWHETFIEDADKAGIALDATEMKILPRYIPASSSSTYRAARQAKAHL